MPNVKRRFADDDPSSDDDEEEEEEEEPQYYQGGGKGMRMLGGKGMGKQLRAAPMQESSDEEDEEEEEEEITTTTTPQVVVQRGGGKQLHSSGGKQLRPSAMQDDSDDDDDDEDDEDEEEEAVVRPVARGGGKTLIRAAAPEDDDGEEEEEEDSEEEPRPIVPMGGGGGKQLRPPPGGKQLRAPVQHDDEEDDDDDDEPVAAGVGKTLRPPRGGKQLRAPAPQSDEEDEDEDEEDEKEEPIAAPEEDVDNDSDEEFEPSKPQPKSVAKPTPEGGKQLRRPPVKGESKSDEDDDDMDVDSDEDDDEPQPVKAAPRTRGRAAAKKRVEESDAMDESEESSDEEMEMDMETFDTQRLVQNDEDQKYLDSLPEIEREAILAERFEKRKAQVDMKKALREAKKQERESKTSAAANDSKSKKATPSKKPPARKAKAIDDGDEKLAKSLASKRESARNKDAKGTKAQKAKALAALREERKKATRKEESDSQSDFGDDDEDSDDDYEDSGAALKPWQKKAMERRSSSRLDQALSDDDDDEDDVKEENEEVAAIGAGQTIAEAELEEYQKITLPRRRLGRWCNEPYFNDAVMNCFVKLFIGENDLGKRCYRLCKIVEVKTQKPYQLPSVNHQKPVTTDKMLTLKFGKNQRDFPISLVSDAKIDEADMKQFIDATKANRERTLGKKEANKMRRQQDKLVREYVYTTKDIEDNLQNRKLKGESAANLALERTRAAIAVQGARAALKDATFQLTNAKNANDLAEIKSLESLVEDAEKALEEKLIEEQVVKDRVKDRKMRLTGRTKDQKWALVNKRALEINQKVDRGEMIDKDAENENSASKDTFNPYARRKVKPKILWEVGQKEDEDKAEAGKDHEDATKNKTADSNENGEKDLDATPTLIQEHHHKAAVLNQSHQFAIDEEVLAQSSYTIGIAGLSSKKVAKNRVRQGWSLSEYQERKAAGTLY